MMLPTAFVVVPLLVISLLGPVQNRFNRYNLLAGCRDYRRKACIRDGEIYNEKNGEPP